MAYRAIHDRIWDDEQFWEFSADAKLVVFFLRTRLPATGLGRMTNGDISESTKVPLDRLSHSLSELTEAGWVEQEGPFMWLVRGLEHDPSLSVKSGRHRTMIQNIANQHPNRPISQRWRERYSLWYSLSHSLSKTPEAPPEQHSLSDSLSTIQGDRETGDREESIGHSSDDDLEFMDAERFIEGLAKAARKERPDDLVEKGVRDLRAYLEENPDLSITTEEQFNVCLEFFGLYV